MVVRAALARHCPGRRVPHRRRTCGLRAELRHSERRGRGRAAQPHRSPSRAVGSERRPSRAFLRDDRSRRPFRPSGRCRAALGGNHLSDRNAGGPFDGPPLPPMVRGARLARHAGLALQPPPSWPQRGRALRYALPGVPAALQDGLVDGAPASLDRRGGSARSRAALRATRGDPPERPGGDVRGGEPVRRGGPAKQARDGVDVGALGPVLRAEPRRHPPLPSRDLAARVSAAAAPHHRARGLGAEVGLRLRRRPGRNRGGNGAGGLGGIPRRGGPRPLGGAAANHGVYLVAGEAAGLYTRLSIRGTDRHALSAPVLVRPEARP